MRVFIKNRIPFYFIFFIYTPASFAQDYSFSQFWENRIYYNPSFVGLNEGEFNGQLTYRKLWPKFPGNFSTIFFWRGYFNKEKNIYFQLGVKGSYYDERLNPNKYIYSGNLHEIYGNILPLPALDIVNEKQNYWDFSTGFMIYVPWERHYREFMHNFIGFSVNHFTRPKDNFIEENARIPIKLSLQWNSFIRTSLYSLDKKSSLYVCPGLLYENRGDRLLSPSSFDNFIVGSDITTDPLFGGVWYSSQLLNSDKENYKAIIFKLGLKLNSANKKFEYRLAYSYDMSLGNLVKSTEGSHEISFNITYRFNAKYRYNIFSF